MIISVDVREEDLGRIKMIQNELGGASRSTAIRYAIKKCSEKILPALLSADSGDNLLPVNQANTQRGGQ